MILTRATILFVLLAVAAGHFYYWHVREEILAAERNYYFIKHDKGPVSSAPAPSMSRSAVS